MAHSTSDPGSGTALAPQIHDALPPFDKDTADIILRSSDLVDFRVRKSILEEASDLFKDMFSLPQSKSCTGEDNGYNADLKDGIAIIAMAEDSRTLDSLLRICYPTPNPDLSDTGQLRSVLRAALKYTIDGAVEPIKVQIRAIAIEEPLRIYAIALESRLHDEARAAAKYSLNHRLQGVYVPELELIPAGAYYRLLNYRERCSDAVNPLRSGTQWVLAAKMAWFEGPYCTCQAASTSIATDAGTRTPKKWWWDLVQKMQAITDLTPCGKALTTSIYQHACSAITTVALCSSCRTSVSSQLESFIRSYAAEVDRVTDQISLDIAE